MYTHDFVKLKNPSSGEVIIVSEHTDELFFKGFTKLVGHVPNSTRYISAYCQWWELGSVDCTYSRMG